jgi:hypothetical protein
MSSDRERLDCQVRGDSADSNDNLDTDDPFSCPFAAIKKTQS